MEVAFPIASGFILFLTFRFVDRFVARHLFSEASLTGGRFVSKQPILASIYIFLFSYFLFCIIYTDILVVYFLPGFFASILSVWPFVANPEILPSKSAEHKIKLYTSSTMLVLSFSLLSFSGGLFASGKIPQYLPLLASFGVALLILRAKVQIR